MDAVYRAMDGGSGRVALSEEARRRKDRDAERRARRKGYAAGLTSGLVDAYWREATECVGNRRVAPSPAPVTMSGEQAVAFFSRTGLPNDVLATVWDLAKSGRKGDPPGLTKPEFERAACLISFGIHESESLLKSLSRDAGGDGSSVSHAVQKKTTSKNEAKRLRYAKAGMFWKFEAFDVKPVESMPQRRDGVFTLAKQKTEDVAKPLVAPITLNVPTRNGKKKKNQSDAFFRDKSSSSSDDADGSTSNWEARFPEEHDPSFEAEKWFSQEKDLAKSSDETPKTRNAVADPFADLVAALSAAPEVSPRKIVASTSSDPAKARRADLKRAPHLLDEFPGVDVDVDVSFDVMRLEDSVIEKKNRPPADPAASSASDPAFAFETLRGPEAFAFDFSGKSFETGAFKTGATKDEAVDEDDVAPMTRADDDVLGDVARGEPEETRFGNGFARGFFEDDGDERASPRSPPRPARDPEMDEWSAACRAWPWLAGEARAEERRDEEATEAEAGWAAF